MAQFVDQLPHQARLHEKSAVQPRAETDDNMLRAQVWRGVAAFTVLFWGTLIYLVTG